VEPEPGCRLGRMGDKKDGFEDMGLEGSAFEALEPV